MFLITCKACGFSVDITTDNVSQIVIQPGWSSKGGLSDRVKGWAKEDNLILAYTMNDDEDVCGVACKCGNEV